MKKQGFNTFVFASSVCNCVCGLCLCGPGSKRVVELSFSLLKEGGKFVKCIASSKQASSQEDCHFLEVCKVSILQPVGTEPSKNKAAYHVLRMGQSGGMYKYRFIAF